MVVDELDEAELGEIEKRWAATTPGPWTSHVEGRDHTSGSDFIMTGTEEHRGPDIELSGTTIEDQDFIAACKQDIPRLIATIRRLRKS